MKAVGIILAGGNNNRMGELSRKRAIPAGGTTRQKRARSRRCGSAEVSAALTLS